MAEFYHWKEREEQTTHTNYSKMDRTYQPKGSGRFVNTYTGYFFVPNVYIPYASDVTNRHCLMCCRVKHCQQNEQERATKMRRPNHSLSKKINQHCTSRMYVDEHQDQHVTVTYIATHTGHELGPENYTEKCKATADKPQKHFHCPFSCQCSTFCTLTELLTHSHAEHDNDLGKPIKAEQRKHQCNVLYC